ncbi:MAG: hypothetical protein U1F43_26425 [Myxococcota bacterium]
MNEPPETPTGPEAATPEAPLPAPHPPDSPVCDAALEAARTDLQKIWKRIEKRAPDEVKRRVADVFAAAEVRIGNPRATLAERLDLGKRLEDLAAEVRGRKAFEPSFYTGGRFGIIVAHDPVSIQGSIDHLRIEQFFERYMRRAEQAFERLEYFMTRAGLLQPKEKPKKPAWEQPYASFEQYHELIWGRKKKRRPPRLRPHN